VSLFFTGTFPGMINSAVFKSPWPDRYPLNANTSLYVNVFVSWTSYLPAAIFAERAVWLGMATMTVSISIMNVVGIVKQIDWMKDKDSPYIFPQRCLLPHSRKIPHGRNNKL